MDRRVNSGEGGEKIKEKWRRRPSTMEEETQYNGKGSRGYYRWERRGRWNGGKEVVGAAWSGLVTIDRGDRLVCYQIQLDFNSIPDPPPTRFLFDYFSCTHCCLHSRMHRWSLNMFGFHTHYLFHLTLVL